MDVNEEVVGSNVQFDALNGFASGLRERQNTPEGFLFGTLRDSHESPFLEGDLWSGLRPCSLHGRGPTFFIHECRRQMEVEKLNFC